MTLPTIVKADPLPWLLEEDNPSVRYLTLVHLLRRPPEDAEARAAREAIRTSRWVQAICADQRRDGAWLGGDFYVPKGRATFWRLSLLGDLGLTLADHCDLVRRGCEFIFRHQGDDGAFRRMRRQEDGRWARDKDDMPCTQARIVRALIQLGYGDDPRTKRAIAWLVRTQREDGAWLCDRRNDRHGCLRAAVDYLRAIELFPPMKKNPTTRQAAEFVTSLLLQPGMGRFHVAEQWTVFEFPYFNYGLVPALSALLQVGMPPTDPSLARAIECVRGRQREDGTWALDAAPRGPTDLGRVGEPNKWLTLDALRVLAMAGG